MDRKLKEHLLKESQYPDHVKDDIWAQIEARLDGAPVEEARRTTTAASKRNSEAEIYESTTIHTDKKKRSNYTMKMIKWTTGVAAAAIAVTAFLAMPPGEALMKSVQQWFAPEKKIEVEVEGQKEETQGQVHINEESRYAIYYDKDRYKMVQEEGRDVITTIDPLPEPYPQVSLTIEQDIDTQPEELAKEIAAKLAGQFAEVRGIEKVSEPVNSYLVHAIDGQDHLSKVISVYVTSNEQQGSFILTSNYFLEAAEGHGSRFYQTLKQFEVLTPGEQ